MIQLTFMQLVFLSIGGTFLALLFAGWLIVSRRRRQERDAWQRNIICRGCMNPYRLDTESESAPCPYCGRINDIQHRPLL